jgi:Flp pilus assembly protein CpaB
VAGVVAPGDLVNVMALVAGDGGGPPIPRSTVTVVEGVEVLAVSNRVGSGSASGASATAPPATLVFVLAVPTDQVTRVVQAAGYHELYLSLPADGAPDRGAATVDDAALVGGGVAP